MVSAITIREFRQKRKGFSNYFKLTKDNHSLMQLYLDGNKNNFFTIFDITDQKGQKIKNKNFQVMIF